MHSCQEEALDDSDDNDELEDIFLALFAAGCIKLVNSTTAIRFDEDGLAGVEGGVAAEGDASGADGSGGGGHVDACGADGSGHDVDGGGAGGGCALAA